MMKSTLLSILVVILGGLLVTGEPLFAHHGLSAQFDRDQPVSLTGEIVKVEWLNPHIWIYIDVAQDDGSVMTWGLSSSSPFMLQRRGITRDTLKIGEEIMVNGFRARDGSNNAAGQLRYGDGRQLYVDPEVEEITR